MGKGFGLLSQDDTNSLKQTNRFFAVKLQASERAKNGIVLCLWNGLFQIQAQCLYRQELEKIKKRETDISLPY